MPGSSRRSSSEACRSPNTSPKPPSPKSPTAPPAAFTCAQLVQQQQRAPGALRAHRGQPAHVPAEGGQAGAQALLVACGGVVRVRGQGIQPRLRSLDSGFGGKGPARSREAQVWGAWVGVGWPTCKAPPPPQRRKGTLQAGALCRRGGRAGKSKP